MTLTNLQPDETYFARSFALNEAGINYGNSVRFVAEEISAVEAHISQSSKLMIYPNPTTNIINIESVDGYLNIASVQLFDLKGRNVLQQYSNGTNAYNGSLELGVSDLPNGLYAYEIRLDNGLMHTGKILISR